jgi:hypothetical protein
VVDPSELGAVHELDWDLLTHGTQRALALGPLLAPVAA